MPATAVRRRAFSATLAEVLTEPARVLHPGDYLAIRACEAPTRGGSLHAWTKIDVLPVSRYGNGQVNRVDRSATSPAQPRAYSLEAKENLRAYLEVRSSERELDVCARSWARQVRGLVIVRGRPAGLTKSVLRRLSACTAEYEEPTGDVRGHLHDPARELVADAPLLCELAGIRLTVKRVRERHQYMLGGVTPIGPAHQIIQIDMLQSSVEVE